MAQTSLPKFEDLLYKLYKTTTNQSSEGWACRLLLKATHLRHTHSSRQHSGLTPFTLTQFDFPVICIGIPAFGITAHFVTNFGPVPYFYQPRHSLWPLRYVICSRYTRVVRHYASLATEQFNKILTIL